MQQECVRKVDLSPWIKLICLIIFSALSTSKVLASSLELELNRKMINHFTNYLSSTQDNIEGVLFDLSEDRFVVAAVFEGKNFSMLNWIKPTLRPGEIFLSASQRTGKVSSLDEKDFVFKAESLSFTIFHITCNLCFFFTFFVHKE